MSKREVKKIDGLEKELFSETERVELWISKNWVKTAIAALLLVVVCVGIYAFVQHQEKSTLEAQQKLFSAPKEELAAMIEKYPDTPGIELAMLRQASFLKADKKYGDAVAMLNKIVSNADSDIMLRQIAAMERCALLELDGKIDEAIAAYKNVADDNGFSSGIKAEAAFQAARLLVSKKNIAEAKKLLQRIIDRKAGIANDMSFTLWLGQCEQLQTAIDNGDFAEKKPAAPAKRPAAPAKRPAAKK